MRHAHSQRGVMLLTALFTVALVATYLSVTMARSFTESQAATRFADMAQVFNVAEAGIDNGVAAVKNQFLTTGEFPATANPNDPTNTIIPIPLPQSFAGYSFDTSQGPYVIYEVQPANVVFQSGPFQGMSGRSATIRVSADAVSNRTQARTRLVQTFQLQRTGIFQFAIFFDGVLRLTPGPPMTLNGTIRSNADILTNHTDLVGPFRIDGIVQAAGNFKHNNPDKKGDIQIKDANGNYQSMCLANCSSTPQWLDSTHPQWATKALERWGGTVKDKAQGVSPVKLPLPEGLANPIDLIKPGQTSDSPVLKANRLYYKADLRILVDQFDNVRTESRSGGLEILPSGTVEATSKDFYDLREKQMVKVTQIDVSQLSSFSANPDDGGFILYVAAAGPGEVVRLVNGKCLPLTGLTVVTENPLYVKGDYNTGAGCSGGKKPAALMSDALTVLSANWNDQKNQGPTKFIDRKATSTTINAAVMTGISPVTADSNPGSEADLVNYMRLLEDWKSPPRTLAYRGSLINFWVSQKAQGPLFGSVTIGGVTYTFRNPPIRDFGFDTSFLQALPPGSPQVFYLVPGFWQQQED